MVWCSWAMLLVGPLTRCGPCGMRSATFSDDCVSICAEMLPTSIPRPDRPSNYASEASSGALRHIWPPGAPHRMPVGLLPVTRQFVLTGGSQYWGAMPTEVLTPAIHPAEVHPVYNVMSGPAFAVPWSVPGYASPSLHGCGMYVHAAGAHACGLARSTPANVLPKGHGGCDGWGL